LERFYGAVEDGEYADGTTSLFAGLELKTSRVIGQLHRSHRSREFKEGRRGRVI
jgi:hypothetical protein